MNIESQVCSFDPSKRLKELGIKQKSLFHWMASKSIQFIPELEEDDGSEYVVGYLPRHLKNTTDHYSALTVAELGEMLPYEFRMPNTFAPCSIKYWKREWGYAMVATSPNRENPSDNTYYMTEQRDKNEANVRAKFLIYLIENNLIDIKDINSDK